MIFYVKTANKKYHYIVNLNKFLVENVKVCHWLGTIIYTSSVLDTVSMKNAVLGKWVSLVKI